MILGGSSLAYWGISANSWVFVLKYVNLIGFLHTGEMMAVYRNIGLYGFPVSYITVGIVFFIVAGILLFRELYFSSVTRKLYPVPNAIFCHRGSGRKKYGDIVYFTGKQKRYCIIRECF